MITIQGEICEVGELTPDGALGVTLMCNGVPRTLLGLSKDECKELCAHLYDEVTITIVPGKA